MFCYFIHCLFALLMLCIYSQVIVNRRRKKYGLPVIDHNQVFIVPLNECNKSQLKKMLNKNTGGRHRKKKRKQSKLINKAYCYLSVLQMHYRKLKYMALDTKYQLMVEQKLKLSDEIKILQHSITNIEVKVADLQRLRSGGWLNDEIINMYMSLLQDRNSRRRNSSKDNIFLLGSFFFAQLRQNGYDGVKRWGKSFRKYGYTQKYLSDFDIVVFPVHITRDHWVCGLIDFKRKRIECYDSLNLKDTDYFVIIRQYLADEFKHKLGAMIDFKVWRNINHGDQCPQQKNFKDCGVFVVKCMDWLCDQIYPDFVQEDMEYFRRRLMIEIIIGRTLD